MLENELYEDPNYPYKFGNPMSIGYHVCLICDKWCHRMGENFCIFCGTTDDEICELIKNGDKNAKHSCL